MNGASKTYFLLFCLLNLQSLSAHAESKFFIAPGFMNFDYVETGPDGKFLDGEKGNIPGVLIGLELDTSGSMSFGFQFEHYSGEVDYDGHIQSTDPAYDELPMQSKTDQSVTSFAGVLKHTLADNPNFAVYGMLILKRWERDIKPALVSGIDNFGNPFQNLPVSGLFEVYEWRQITIGMTYKMRVSDASYLEFNGGFLRTISPTMEVESFTLSLGEELGYTGGIAWKYKINQYHSLGISGNYTYWEFGRSNVVFGIYEPDSESEMVNINVLYQHMF
ncbi:hypothetical protein [Kaarinaea lacus]